MTDQSPIINILFKEKPNENIIKDILNCLNYSNFNSENILELLNGKDVFVKDILLFKLFHAINISLRKEESYIYNLSLDFSWDEIIKSIKELEKLIALIKKIYSLANPYFIYMDYEMVSFVNNKIDFANKKVLGFNQICLFSKTMLNEFENLDLQPDSYKVEHLSDGTVFMIKNDLIESVKKWEENE